MSAEILQIFAAISPNGEIVKSSVSPFRIHAVRYANARKNFQVVKLTDLSVEIKAAAKQPEFTVDAQQKDPVVEVPEMKRTKRKYTRKNKDTTSSAA